MAPVGDPYEALVSLAQPANVDTVIVDGRILRQSGKFAALDHAKVVRENGHYHVVDLQSANGVRVNGVAPGYIRTAQLLSEEHSLGPAGAEKAGEFIPMGRIGEPEEIADVILFLASNAARYDSTASRFFPNLW
jgi:hypothetical protein